MISKRSRFALLGVLALALGVFAGPGVAQAKKLKPFEEQVTVNASIPNFSATAPSVPVISTIEVPKKYKKQKVADVNVTNFQTSGSAAGAAEDLDAALTAPNGRTILILDSSGDISLGPWTMDDDTNVSICDQTPGTGMFCESPLQALYRPFAGTSNLKDDDDDIGFLNEFDLTRMRGTWTLRIWDEQDATTSVLNQWGLKIKPLRLKPPTVKVD